MQVAHPAHITPSQIGLDRAAIRLPKRETIALGPGTSSRLEWIAMQKVKKSKLTEKQANRNKEHLTH